jgi:hypothetical protein
MTVDAEMTGFSAKENHQPAAPSFWKRSTPFVHTTPRAGHCSHSAPRDGSDGALRRRYVPGGHVVHATCASSASWPSPHGSHVAAVATTPSAFVPVTVSPTQRVQVSWPTASFAYPAPQSRHARIATVESFTPFVPRGHGSHAPLETLKNSPPAHVPVSSTQTVEPVLNSHSPSSRQRC